MKKNKFKFPLDKNNNDNLLFPLLEKTTILLQMMKMQKYKLKIIKICLKPFPLKNNMFFLKITDFLKKSIILGLFK